MLSEGGGSSLCGATEGLRERGGGAKFVNPPLSESASFFTSLTRCLSLPSVGSAPSTDAALPKWEFDGCAQFDAASSLEFVDVVILAESILGSSFRRENVSARLSVFGSSKVPFCSSLSSVAFFLKVGKLEMLSGAIELDGQSDIGGSFSLSTSLL